MSRVWNKRDPNVPSDAVYVGRGTPWGNPFKLFKEADRDLVCDLFEERALPKLDVSPLVGKHLVCWCAPKRCHADALLRAAIAMEAQRGATPKSDAPAEGGDSADPKGIAPEQQP